MARFSLRIDDEELLDWVERCAQAEGRSMNYQIIEMLRETRARYGEVTKLPPNVKPRRKKTK